VIKAFIKGEVHDNTSRFVLAACGLLFAVGGLVLLLVFSQFAVYRQQYRIESGFASIKESQTSIKETQTGIKETQTVRFISLGNWGRGRWLPLHSNALSRNVYRNSARI
jgi:hypothetical protein